MSYLVLARKYRPKSFTEMVGQEHVVQALSNALERKRLHHAYLFTGTRGVGKTTVSRILAKSLNCIGTDGQGDITAQPCGVCEVCRAIDAGRFVDYTELDAASNRGVEEVQSLLEQAVYKPVQGRFKVFMIDEVHMLSNTAFNAMLKTLEEPPEYLKFVLATTDPQKVPVTVLSRCLQFNLRPMAPETVLEHLQHVLGAESVSSEEGALKLLSRAARGSMRDALSLTDQAIAFGGGSLEEAKVRQMLGAVDRSYVFRLIEALAVGDGKAVIETSEALRTNGLSAGSTLEDMATVLQRMAVAQQVPESIDRTDSESAEVGRLAQLMPADETQLLYSIAIHGRSELGLAPDEYAGLTMTLLRLLAFKPKGFKPQSMTGYNAAAASEAEKKSLKPASPESRALAPAPSATPNPAPSPTPGTAPISALTSQKADFASFSEEKRPLAHIASASPAINSIANETSASAAGSAPLHPDSSLADDEVAVEEGAGAIEPEAVPIRYAIPVREQPAPSARVDSRIAPVAPDAHHEAWVALVQQLLDAQALSGLARELAVQSQCVEKGAAHLTLRVSQPSLKGDVLRDELQAALGTFGRQEAIVIELGPAQDSWAQRNQIKMQAQQKAAEDLIMNDPLVQELIGQWGAKIVPGSIRAV
jgi:DNA polymerase III subunit gamma/tau